MWLQAYTRFMTALVAADTTTKQESVGLAAHLHLILQLHKDLAGIHWLHYDQDFREWAAARGVRKWGKLNLTIYGRCLSGQHPQSVPKEAGHGQGSRQSGEKRKSTGLSRESACFKWNFGEECNRTSAALPTHPFIVAAHTGQKAATYCQKSKQS